MQFARFFRQAGSVLALCTIAATSAVALYAQRTPAPVNLEVAFHDYLMNHPDVLIEMTAKLQREQAKQAIENNRDELAAIDGVPVEGAGDADVTLVEFYDVRCGYCKAMAPTLDRALKEDRRFRVIFREYPILSEESVLAAKAELAAQLQGKFAPLHSALMADRSAPHQLDEKKIIDYAAAAGIDTATLLKDMASPAIEKQIADNRALAAKLGVAGTPGLIFLGQSHTDDDLNPGMLEYDALVAKLAQMRHIITATTVHQG